MKWLNGVLISSIDADGLVPRIGQKLKQQRGNVIDETDKLHDTDAE